MNTLVKLGYKLTEVGVIPEDWDVTTIGQVVNDFRGGAALKPSEFSTTGVRVLPKGGVGYGGILQVAEDDWQFCSQAYADKHANNQVDNNYTILVLRDLVPSGPSIGLVVRITDSKSYVLAQGVYGFKVSTQRLEQGYIIQLSNTLPYRKLMNSIMVGSTQVHITNTAYKLAPIPLPPLQEQRLISESLSDTDALISGLERLIDKKCNIKKAITQQLLTGQQRLPGFSGAWEAKRLGEISKIGRGRVISHREISASINPQYPVYSSQTSNSGIMGYIDTYDFEGEYITWTTDGENAGTAFHRNGKFNCTNVCGTIKLNQDNAVFLTSVLRHVMPKHVSRNLANPKLMNDAVKKIEVYIPQDLGEQNAIATILSNMDSELASLESRRDKARQLKQGMMQELLTGRIRLFQSSQEAKLC